MEVYERQEYEAYNMLQQSLDLYNHRVQTLNMTRAIIENVAEDDEFMEWDMKYVGHKELKLVDTDDILQVNIFPSLLLVLEHYRTVLNSIEHSRTSILSNQPKQHR